LDTNVYCRPLDDQANRRIRKESQAFLEIADKAFQGEVKIVSSDYVKFEVEQIHNSLKRKDVRGFERTLSLINVHSSRSLIALAREFSARCNVNALDALHIAAACHGEASVFITCDDEIVDKRTCIEKLAAEKEYRLKVRNPINYLQERWRVRL
jgi:predicted nucleic acid-binding protein